jgi:protein-L-isoaspartate(D-aspartate) O-methyltransferase
VTAALGPPAGATARRAAAAASRRTALARQAPWPRRLAAAGLALCLALAGGVARSSAQAVPAAPAPPARNGAARQATVHRQLPPRRIARQAALARMRQPPLPSLPPPRFIVPPPPPFMVPPPPRSVVRESYDLRRRDMVNQQLRQRGISQPEVLAAMQQVPRHLFLPERMRGEAYADRALQLGPSRTIYQPYVVALMTSLLELKHGDTVLEVGTGTGYHAAVLSRIARRVYSIEIDPVVASQAEGALQGMGYHNVQVWVGDGYGGLPEKAPFDAILLSAAPPRIPQPLIDQLRVGGKMVVPLGGVVQDLLVITKTNQGIEKRAVVPVRVSPMTGQVQDGH